MCAACTTAASRATPSPSRGVRRTEPRLLLSRIGALLKDGPVELDNHDAAHGRAGKPSMTHGSADRWRRRARKLRAAGRGTEREQCFSGRRPWASAVTWLRPATIGVLAVPLGPTRHPSTPRNEGVSGSNPLGGLVRKPSQTRGFFRSTGRGCPGVQSKVAREVTTGAGLSRGVSRAPGLSDERAAPHGRQVQAPARAARKDLPVTRVRAADRRATRQNVGHRSAPDDHPDTAPLSRSTPDTSLRRAKPAVALRPRALSGSTTCHAQQ
jgi:hypothetical protein